jgi:hypothetical protein
VNRRLYNRKPRFTGRSVGISDYRIVKEPWLAGVSNAVRDILAFDDKEEDCWYAYATVRKAGETVFYWIPREWVKRLTVNKHGNFVLLPFEFCCRQVLKRSDCKLVRCQSHFIPARYHVDQHYFHIGCGPCHKDMSHVISKFPMFIGVKQLVEVLERAECSELIVALLISSDAIDFKFKKAKKDGDKDSFGCVKATYLCEILKHILVCRVCYVNLEKFVSVLDRFLSTPASYMPMNDFDDSVPCEFYHNDKVPCDKYVIDGEFDVMRSVAYDGITLDNSYVIDGDSDDDSIKLDDSYHEVVNTFIETYFV